jgi:hypothetical protein
MFRGLIPLFPNLDIRFLYEFGDQGVRNTLFSGELLVPYATGPESDVFTDFYFGYHGFPSRSGSREINIRSGQNSAAFNLETERIACNRMDLSVGGGYRRFVGSTMLGLNAYYDAPRIFDTWFGTWGWGVELVSLFGGGGMADLTFNSYGNPISIYGTAENWKDGVFSCDVEGGYSQPILDGEFDLRVKGVGYQWTTGTHVKIRGLRAGVELGAANGMARAGIDYGYDESRGRYGTLMAHLNLGFQFERLFRGENPFSLPEPAFNGSDRNIRRILTQRVRRNRNIPGQVVSTAMSSGSVAFVVTINGPYSRGNGQYVQHSPTSATWAVRDDGNCAGGGWGQRLARAENYTVRVVGDVSGLHFPLTATITPVIISNLDHLRVSQIASDDGPESVTFNSSGNLVRTVPCGGNNPCTASNLRPMVQRPVGGCNSPGIGQILISAPGVPTLVIHVTLVSGP